MRRAAFFLMWALLTWALPLPADAAPIGVLTIVDGEALVLRGTHKFAGAEGLALLADDIVHTGAKARLVRIEFADGGALDLGAATRVLLRPRFAEAHADRPRQLYVSQGWVKLTASPSQQLALSSPSLDLLGLTGAAVACVRMDASFAFIEAGQARLVEHLHGQPLRALALTDGRAYERHAGDRAAVISRPSTQMLESMPRAFADSLPLRAARYKNAEVAPAMLLDISYHDVAPWINAERALRPSFVQRFAARSREAGFRAALIADLRSHPEWGRVLFADKTPAKKKAQAVASAISAPPPVATRNADTSMTTVAATQLAASADTTRPLRPWEERER